MSKRVHLTALVLRVYMIITLALGTQTWLTCMQPSLSKLNGDGSRTTPGQWLVLVLPWERGFIQQSVPQTLWPEMAIWKLPCLKASIRQLWSVASSRKSRLWLMRFHTRQWSLQLNLYWKKKDRCCNINRNPEWREAWADKDVLPDQIIELNFTVLSLQIKIFMSVWNYPWMSIASQ